MNESFWPYPGSRWWKFDFHTHTPVSVDTYWASKSIHLSPEEWLSKYMVAEIDCVVVTDHNSGEWIDKLKSAYASMKDQTCTGTPRESFRELTIFPGVEISVSGGFHLLAVFDPSATTRIITDLLAAVGYQGTDGDSDGVTRAGPENVVKAVLDAGGIPILAHADQENGLLHVEPGTRQCALDANTVRQVMEIEDWLAIEWIDTNLLAPEAVAKKFASLARVLGSDCHSFRGHAVPGSRYTWAKMADPTLEGLRLALLDGNGVSIRRRDEGVFKPFTTPDHFITAIEIDRARYMGNSQAQRIELTPYYNALIGGRGTGKSTVVHALRLALRRDEELKRLGDNAEPLEQFRRFCQVARNREGEGALRSETEIRVEWEREGQLHRLRWRKDGADVAVEERDAQGSWQTSNSQAIHAERFPVRLFSQGQIATMAGEGREALLGVIDEAAGLAQYREVFEKTKRAYFATQAKLRELEAQLTNRPEVKRKLTEITKKIETLSRSQHADILKAHQCAQRQQREVQETLQQLDGLPSSIDALVTELVLDDWAEGVFDDTSDADLLTWRGKLEQSVIRARGALEHVAAALRADAQSVRADARLQAWRARVEQARTNYEQLQTLLAAQGITDSQSFDQLVQERQELEDAMKQLGQIEQERDRLAQQAETQLLKISETRKRITEARSLFVQEKLRDNPYVRISVVPYGFEPRTIERSLRELLEASDDRFEGDILTFESGQPSSGLALDIAQGQDKKTALNDVKKRLIDIDGFGGHFRNYIERKLQRPEFADHIRCWFPEDDLRIEYSRGGDGQNWTAITQGSQGQRSAALLAFLLAFGDEPLVLDQPEDDLDNYLIYDLIVHQIRENKLRRQLIIVTHNPNVVVNGDAELVHVFDFTGQCYVAQSGALQEGAVREEVCRVMEGGREAFSRRWARLGREV